MTFYVTHEGTNYQLVNEFFNRGNEIASHTVTYDITQVNYGLFKMTETLRDEKLICRHKNENPYWMNTTVDFWKIEAGRQREIINTYSNVPFDQIQVCTIIII